MSKSGKNIPQLRFPEFMNELEWKEKKLGSKDISNSISSGKDKNDSNGTFDLYGSTGIIGKSFKKSYTGKYILVARVGANAGLLTKVNGSFGVTDNTLVINLVKTTNVDFVFSVLERFGLNKLIFGSGQPLITGKQLKELPLLFPRPKEQKKIANCLISIDNLILSSSKKVEALKEHKKGLMQQLFPKDGENVPERRFPEFRGGLEWEEKPLSKLLTIGSGRDYKHLSNGNIPVYGTGGYMLAVNDYLYDGESVCIGRKGTIDKPMFLTGKFWTVDTLFYTHSFKNCIPKYIYYYFGTINWYNYNEAGGVPSLSKTTLNKINIPIPPNPNNDLAEQEKITNFLSSIDNLIDKQTKKVEALKEHKKGLMQQLFPNSKAIDE